MYLAKLPLQQDLVTVKSILDGVTLGMALHTNVHDPTMVEGDQHLEQEVHITSGCTLAEMHVTDWVEALRGNLMLSAVLDWLKAQKQTNLRNASGATCLQ